MAVFISCCKKKKKTPSLAKELYCSDLFKKSLKWALRIESCDNIFILSALHGIIPLSQMINPYNVTLNEKSRKEKEDWARKVIEQSKVKCIDMKNSIYLCGKNYLEPIEKLLGCKLQAPLGNLGLGKRLHILEEWTKDFKEEEFF